MRGVSTVVVTTEAFLSLADQMAKELLIPAARIAVVSHPIGGTPEEALIARADASIDELIGCLAR